MNNIRPAAVAGLFYAADAHALKEDINHYLDAAQHASDTPKAIIAPHAGYIYSGAVAAIAYTSIRARADKIRSVVLLGPAHRLPFYGLAAVSYHGFATPLGVVPVDQGAMQSLLRLKQVQVLDAAHREEHSLEVHLPFLQVVLGAFQLIPLLVGETKKEHVAEVLQMLWGGTETLIVISSDLSHYRDYATAQRMDRATSLAIEHLQSEPLHHDMACGCNPINGLLQLAKEKNMRVKTLALQNSGDTAGSKDRVVGYGAYAFY
jgi:hypothetical protein